MSIKFNEVIPVIHGEEFGHIVYDKTLRHQGEPKITNFLITDDGVATGSEKLDFLIDELREEYAPTVEMTKTDKDVLLCYLENYSFCAFIETIHRSKNNTFGIPANKEFENLSDEDLMQAWLHPETIKVVE